jgi:HPr kinase/phosphorylase
LFYLPATAWENVVEWARLEQLCCPFFNFRGLGILYIPDLFGPDSVVESVSVGLVCELERWREGAHYDRLGLDRTGVELLGVEIPRLVLPARPGGSMATVVEVGAREHRRRQDGVNSAARLDARLRREMDRP